MSMKFRFSVEENIQKRNGWRFAQGFTCYFYASRTAKVRIGVVETGECPKQGYKLLKVSSVPFFKDGVAVWTKFWFEVSWIAHLLSSISVSTLSSAELSMRGILSFPIPILSLLVRKGEKAFQGKLIQGHRFRYSRKLLPFLFFKDFGLSEYQYQWPPMS